MEEPEADEKDRLMEFVVLLNRIAALLDRALIAFGQWELSRTKEDIKDEVRTHDADAVNRRLDDLLQ